MVIGINLVNKVKNKTKNHKVSSWLLRINVWKFYSKSSIIFVGMIWLLLVNDINLVNKVKNQTKNH